MAFDLFGQRPAVLAAILLVSMGLAGCTTTEGTNAFSDAGTFEREVMNTTAAGIGLIPPPPEKADPTPRGPLVLPKDTASLPAPEKDTQTALLPTDSDMAKIDTTGLTQDDLNRLRHARVVDLTTPDGRPLTPDEVKQLTAKMKGVRLRSNASIFTPPAQYFEVTANTQDLVCLAKNGDLVAVNDPACPIEIRNVLLKKKS